MIAFTNERQLAEIMRRIREYRGISAAELAAKVHADRRTVRGRDVGEQGYTVAALMETAGALGYDLALIPREDA